MLFSHGKETRVLSLRLLAPPPLQGVVLIHPAVWVQSSDVHFVLQLSGRVRSFPSLVFNQSVPEPVFFFVFFLELLDGC